MKLEQGRYTGNHPKLTGKIGMIKDCNDPQICLFRPLKSNDWFRVHHVNVCGIDNGKTDLLKKFNISIFK